MDRHINEIITLSEYLINCDEALESEKRASIYATIKDAARSIEKASYSNSAIFTKALSNLEYIYPKAKILLALESRKEAFALSKLLEIWQIKCDIVNNSDNLIDVSLKAPYGLLIIDEKLNGVDAGRLVAAIKEKRVMTTLLIRDDSSDCGLNDAEHENAGNANELFAAVIERPFLADRLDEILKNNMPVRYRQRPYLVENKAMPVTEGATLKQDAKVLSLFADELSEIIPKLKGLYKTNINMFRTKVHGVKSSAKQLGYKDLGEKAEILEMCAKTDNVPFIEAHLDDFIKECNALVEEIGKVCRLDAPKGTSGTSSSTLGAGAGVSGTIGGTASDGASGAGMKGGTSGGATAGSSMKKRILVVDDLNSTREYMKNILTVMGYECETADSGARCIEMLKEANLSLVLMDYLMPDMNGVDVLKNIRQLGGECETIPVIAVSGNISADSARQFKESGFDDFVSKPVNVNKLADTLKKYL